MTAATWGMLAFGAPELVRLDEAPTALGVVTEGRRERSLHGAVLLVERSGVMETESS